MEIGCYCFSQSWNFTAPYKTTKLQALSFVIMTSSPLASPVKISDCIEGLLYSTLTFSTSLHQPTVNLSLSKFYISRLLQIDYPEPLYKKLARNLGRCIVSGCFMKEFELIDSDFGSSILKSNDKDWSKIIAEKGSEILTVLERVDFRFHVQEPYFSLLRDGVKTVEGRCAVGDYSRIKPGDLLLINDFLLLEVQNINWYASFFEMLRSEDLSNVLPGIKTIEAGVQVYRKFYTEEKEQLNGVVAISVSRSAPQLYDLLAGLLSELSHDGIGALLGMVSTVGTVADALPPLRSTLVASSMELHSPSVEGNSLTVAARALAKHVSRSGQRWWSHLSGNDINKNKIASEVVDRILNDCCWMNIHFIQPHQCVLEMRVREGYGARWSADGTKFIGFLEPYTEEGYSNGWKCLGQISD